MGSHCQFKVELEQEENGRWIAEVSALPGVMAYGSLAEKHSQLFRRSHFACSQIDWNIGKLYLTNC